MKRTQQHTKNKFSEPVYCDDCKSNDDQLNKLISKSERVKRENNKLRTNLRQISKTLDENLEKIQEKKLDNTSQVMNPERKKQLLDKELKNVENNLKVYKNYHKNLEHQIEAGGVNLTSISGMLRVVDNRKHELSELQAENKSLWRLKRESDRILAKVNPDQILNRLRDEILMSKDLIKEAKKSERINEKNFKKQQEYITKLDLKHREVCEKLGADYEVQQPTKEELFPDNNQSTLRTTTEKAKKTFTPKERQPLYVAKDEDSDIEEKDMELTWEKFKKFQKKIDILEKFMKTDTEKTEKQYKALSQQYDQLVKSNSIIQEQLDQREKELEILLQKLKDMRGLERNTDRPKSSSSSYQIPVIKDPRNKFSRGKMFRHLQAGLQVSSNSSHSFKDSTHLPNTKDYQIKEVKAQFKDDFIFGLEVVYQLRNGNKEVITCFKNEQSDGVGSGDLKKAQLTLKGTEQIGQIQGYYCKTHIQYLKVLSSRGAYLMAGSERNVQNSQYFSINIQKNEKPISFFGVVDKIPKTKKNKDKIDMYCLQNIGVELRRKDFVISMNVSKDLRNSKLNDSKEEEEDEQESEVEEEEQQQQGNGNNNQNQNQAESRKNSNVNNNYEYEEEQEQNEQEENNYSEDDQDGNDRMAD